MVKELPLNETGKNQKALKDAIIKLTEDRTKGLYPKVIRRLAVYDEKK